MDRPAAVLVGRTNVGKSTLFNRMIGRAHAIVSPLPATTRDVISSLVTWRGSNFWLLDTGGFEPGTNDPVTKASLKQANRAIEEARLILFVIDGTIGPTTSEREYAKHLRKRKTHSILVINKIDNPRHRHEASQIHLGLRETVLVSAKNGSGVGDLLDLIAQDLPGVAEPRPRLRLALIGKTNVGKSTLFNRLIGYERSIVSPTPHTTRDRIHEYFESHGLTLELIDTAGIRRQISSAPRLEQQGAQATLQALREVDVACLMIDGAAQLASQDQRLAELIVESQVAAVVIVNKADLIPFDQRRVRLKTISPWLPMLTWAKVLWVSAEKGEGVEAIIPAAQAAAQAFKRNLTPLEVSRVKNTLKRSLGKRGLAITNFEQLGTRPPHVQVNLETKEQPPQAVVGITQSLLRRVFGLWGTPIKVSLQGKRGNR